MREIRPFLSHAIVGTNDLQKAALFFDEFFAVFGLKRALVQPGRAIYFGQQGLEFGITKPFNGEGATAGNGSMVAFRAGSREQVREAHALALALGGRDEGSPGLRSDDPDALYCAYFRDLDGNKYLIYQAGS